MASSSREAGVNKAIILNQHGRGAYPTGGTWDTPRRARCQMSRWTSSEQLHVVCPEDHPTASQATLSAIMGLDNGVHCLLPQVCSLGTHPSLPRAVVTLVLPAAPAVVLHRLSCPDAEMN